MISDILLKKNLHDRKLTHILLDASIYYHIHTQYLVEYFTFQ